MAEGFCKDTFVDVKAELADGREVMVGMQVLNVQGFEQRILYNAAKSYSRQLQEGEDYTLLNPVIALTLTDFRLFEGEDLCGRFLAAGKKATHPIPRRHRTGFLL